MLKVVLGEMVGDREWDAELKKETREFERKSHPEAHGHDSDFGIVFSDCSCSSSFFAHRSACPVGER